MRKLGVLLILGSRLLWGAGLDTLQLSNIQAGLARIDITPPIGVALGGYANRTGPASGVHDPLHAVILALSDGKQKAVIISLDLLQVMQAQGDAIRDSLLRITSIPPSFVMINASHSHGTPWLDTSIPYQTEVINKIIGGVRMALLRLQPVSIGYGEGVIDFNISRRYVDPSGKCKGILNPAGICDHRVKVLRLDTANNPAPLGVMMHAVCHANVFRQANTEVSADFPGAAKTYIEHVFGGSTTALYLQGCCGDVRANLPDLTDKEGGFGRSGNEGDMVWCGWSLGSEAVKVAARSRVRDFTKQRPVQMEIRAALATLELDADVKKYAEMPYKREKIENNRIRLPLQVVVVGPFWFISMPGEPVVEYGLQIEKMVPNSAPVFVLGYGAADAGYIPAQHMFAEGGYEAGCAYLPSCEEKILERLRQMIKDIQ
jgi:hypothetical protein